MENIGLRVFMAVVAVAAAACPLRVCGEDIAAQLREHAANVQHDLAVNNLADAEREYRAILAINPKSSEAWTGLGVILYGEGRAQDASAALNSALKIDPLQSQAKLFLGLSEAQLRQCDKATPILASQFESQPVGKLQRLTGLALLNCTPISTDAMAAFRIAEKLKTLYPDDPDVLYASAELDTRLWDRDANELITKHPGSYRVHQLAGEVYEAQGNAEQAIREYKSALAENPRLPQMHYRIGQMYLRQGGADADQNAMAEFRQELAIDPESAVSALAMGEIYRHQHKLDDAFTEYKRASTLDPTLIEARVGLAQVLLAEHQLDACAAQLREAIQQDPNSVQAHYVLMLTYRQQGNMAGAEREMAAFRQLQQRKAQHFKSKLNALLNDQARSQVTPSQ